MTSSAVARNEAIHIGKDDIPWVAIEGGGRSRVLHVRPREGLWIVEAVVNPQSRQIPAHHHTGAIWGITMAGAWRYKEYPYVNRAGSFLYEPAGSVHTPQWLEDGTHVYFHMYGALILLDDHGKPNGFRDGTMALREYFERCEAQRIPRPNVIVD